VFRSATIQTAFNRGEFSPLMAGQVGLEARGSAVALMHNMIALKQGPAVRRGGTRFIAPVKDHNKKTALIPFQLNRDQSVIIEFGHQYCRFYRDGGQIVDAQGDPVEVTTPYSQSELFDDKGLLQLRYAQSGDVLYLVCPMRAPRALIRKGQDDWDFTGVALNDGPYMDVNTTKTTLTPLTHGKATVNMMGNALPSGWAAFANSGATNYPAYMAFDDPELPTMWRSALSQRSYVQIKMPTGSGFACDGYMILQSATNDDNTWSVLDYSPSTFTLEGSHDGIIWAVLDRRDGYNGYRHRASDFFEVTNTTAYKYYRLNVLSTVMNGNMHIRVGNLLLSSPQSRTITINASSTEGINGGAGFLSTDVGRQLRMQGTDGKWRWMVITAVNHDKQIVVHNHGAPFTSLRPIRNWRLGLYSWTSGWPKAISFHQNRLVLAGSRSAPDRFDMSIKGGYAPMDIYFQPSNMSGDVGDGDAIAEVLVSNQVNAIQAVVSDTSGLIVLTSGQEWLVSSSNINPILAPNNKTSSLLSNKGCAFIPPILCDYGAMFTSRERQKIYDLVYAVEQDKTKPRDLTAVADHITESGIIGMAYQASLVGVVWMIRSDGLLIGQTYYPDENVFGFHRHSLGGSGKVESIAVIPSSDGSRDDLWMIVKRTINGVIKRYIEVMTPPEEGFHMDSGLSYEGVPVSTVSGLDHLEGETVRVMVDSVAHPDRVVSGGKITLINGIAGATIHVGLGYRWALQTLPLADMNIGAAGQSRNKRITGFSVRLLNTRGFQYGSSPTSKLDHFEAHLPVNGDTPHLLWPAGHEQQGQIYLTGDDVYPACIQAIMPIAAIGEK